MRYETDQAFRMALEARLRDRKLGPAGTTRLRKQIVFERLLARLVVAAPGEWILKGGFALDLRLANVTRTTKDADVEWSLAEEDAVEKLLQAAPLDVGDMFVLAVDRVDERALPGGGERWRLRATLAGRVFETASIDVAFAAAPVYPPDTLVTSMLQFAGFDPVEVPTVGIEQHLAEKLHAYVVVRPDGRENTRTKDLVDMCLFAVTSVVDAARLTGAISVIFGRRGTPIPKDLPPPPRSWRRTWLRLARGLPVPQDLDDGHQLAARLCVPILDGSVNSGSWVPTKGYREQLASTRRGKLDEITRMAEESSGGYG